MQPPASPWRAFFSRGTLISGLIALAVAELQWDLREGPIIIVLVYLHEIGHLLAARWRGLRVYSGPVFLPGFGAFVMVNPSENAWDDVLMSAGGPLVGGAGSLAVRLAGFALHDPILASAGGLALLFNLANLIPIVPFDGGRIVSRIGWLGLVPTLGLIGLGAAVTITRPMLPVPIEIAGMLFGSLLGFTGHPDIFFVGLVALGLWSSFQRLRRLSPSSRMTQLGVAGFYLLTVAALGGALILPRTPTWIFEESFQRRSLLDVLGLAWSLNSNRVLLGVLAAGALYFFGKGRRRSPRPVPVPAESPTAPD